MIYIVYCRYCWMIYIVYCRYCWMMSTFSLPKYYEGEKGKDFIHHGVSEDDSSVLQRNTPFFVFSEPFHERLASKFAKVLI